MKKKVIIKNVQGYYNGERNFVIIPVTAEIRKELSEFCEIPDTPELLFGVSKFVAFSAPDVLDPNTYEVGVGSALISVKLEGVEYDWTYKGKKGHTKKWQVCGLAFKTPLINANLEGLEDD